MNDLSLLNKRQKKLFVPKLYEMISMFGNFLYFSNVCMWYIKWLFKIITLLSTFIALFLERWLYGNASFSSNDHYFSSRRQFYIKNFFLICNGIEVSVLVRMGEFKIKFTTKNENSLCCGKKLDTFSFASFLFAKK